MIRIFLCTIVLTAQMYAQTDSSLVQFILDHTHEIEVQEKKLEGDGSEIIREALVGSQFVLIGEQHGIEEVGHFTDIVFKECQDLDYKYLALEVSPMMAGEMRRRVPEGLDAWKQFALQYPFGVAFYDNGQDYSMLKYGVDHGTIWGLDQVFIAESRILMSRLVEVATSDQQKSMAEKYRQIGEEGAQTAMQSMQMTDLLLFKMTDSLLTEFRQVFAGHEEAIAILYEIEKSRDIYQAYFDKNYYGNNKLRIDLMKEHFLSYYEEAQMKDGAAPKVVLKFGAYHMYRGFSPVQMLDLGNLTHELAAINGHHTVSFGFMGLKGASSNPMTGVQDFDNVAAMDPHLAEALDQKELSGGYYLVDFRPLRYRNLSKLKDDLVDRIHAFDFGVFVPVAKPLEPFGQ